MIFTKKFWQGAGERAVKTFFQASLAAVGVATVLSDVDWPVVASTGALAAILSLMTSIGNADFTAGPVATPEAV